MQIQHVNVKLFVEKPNDVDLEPLIPVFHSWIQEQKNGELLLDVADYRHVPEGPGVVLIGHQGNYSVDNTDNRLGVRYNRKAALEGSNQDRFAQAAQAALKAFQRLEAEARLGGKLRFNGREIELFVNDRLLAPNTQTTRETIDPEIQLFCRRLLGDSPFSLNYPSGDPRKLFGVTVKIERPVTLQDLLKQVS